MRGFPPELIYVLIFAAIFLFQYLMKLAARQSAAEAPAEIRPPPLRYPASLERGFEQAAPLPWSAPQLSAEEFGRRPEAPPVIRQPRRRRYSRQALFATQQDVRKAVVIATILGPCRALEPANGERPSVSR